MGMMPDDEVRSVLDQPARLLLLRIGWPILQLVAPMNRYHHQICQLASQAQLLRQLDRRNLLHSPIGGLDGRHRNQANRQLAEAKELRRADEIQRQQAALLKCRACFVSARLTQIAGVIILRGYQA